MTATELYKNFSDTLHHAHYSESVVVEKHGKPFVSISRARAFPTSSERSKILKRIKARRDRAPDESAKFAADLETIHKTFNTPPAIKW